MSDADKRMIPGEAAEFDDFANSWFDDAEIPEGNDWEENPKGKGKIFPLEDALAFAKAIAEARSLRAAAAVVNHWIKLFEQRGSGKGVNAEGGGTAVGGAKLLLKAIDNMNGTLIVPRYEKGHSEKKPDVIRYVFPIFTCGNMKLPFWTWSKLPIYTCPGRGMCEMFCYSLAHLPQPAPCFTWAQNTLLAHFGHHIIDDAFQLLPEPSVLRIHVDGDFESVEEIDFWMRLLQTRAPEFNGNVHVSGISSYCYSKSLPQLIAYNQEIGRWGKGFMINVSSGGKYDENASVLEAALKIPATRGQFIVIHDERLPKRKVGHKQTEADKEALAKARYDIVSEDMKAMFAGERKYFVCHGKCAICLQLPGGICRHACGYDKFKGTVIGIGVHGSRAK